MRERATTAISRLYTLTGGGSSPPGRRVVSHDGEEAVQSFGSLLGNFLRKKMAGIERAPFNIIAPRLPQRDWSRFLDVSSIKRPLGTPQDQERAD
jgi:hypothetical protein